MKLASFLMPLDPPQPNAMRPTATVAHGPMASRVPCVSAAMCAEAAE
ncbi:MAG: hypothetical protein KGL11_01590 [Alphaproteobacteria bacterium]|nr:hypothetical protein [Alphaproteobacteria bacterium]